MVFFSILNANRNNTLYIHIISLRILIFIKLPFVPIQTLIPFYFHDLFLSLRSVACCLCPLPSHFKDYLTISPHSLTTISAGPPPFFLTWSSMIVLLLLGLRVLLVEPLYLLLDRITSFTTGG